MISALGLYDWIAIVVFGLIWVLYEPFVKRAGNPGGVINADMTVIRIAWMRNMVARDNRLVDGQLIGQVLNSASFFASSNLILMAAAAGALFNGEQTFASASTVAVLKTSSRVLFEMQIGLVVVTLARGLLAFIWSIRQLNYCLAAVGAAPGAQDPDAADEYAAAVARLLNPALSSFNAGVRGYYFAMAAVAWLAGPLPFMLATVGAVALLYRRQRLSSTAGAIANLRRVLERSQPRPPQT